MLGWHDQHSSIDMVAAASTPSDHILFEYIRSYGGGSSVQVGFSDRVRGLIVTTSADVGDVCLKCH